MKLSSISKTVTCLSLASIAIGLTACQKETYVNPYSVDLSVDVSGTTIEMWTGFGTDVQPVIDALCERFTQETGVVVKTKSQGGYDGLKDSIVLASSKRKYPNITVGYPDHFAEYTDSNIIVRLDYYFEHDSEMQPINGKTYPMAITDFYDQYRVENETIQYKEDGTGYILGVPYNKSTEVATYNINFFNWAHSVDADIVVPTTWQEAETVGAKIKTLMATVGASDEMVIMANPAKTEFVRVHSDLDDESYPEGFTKYLDFRRLDFSRFRPFSYDSLANLFITELRNWNSSYTVVDKETGEGYLDFGESAHKTETIEMLTYFKRLYDNGILGVPKTWNEDKYCSTPFQNNLSVFTMGSTAGADHSVAQGSKFDVGAAPVLYNAERPNDRYVISQGTNLCLLDKGSEKQRVASWLLLKYLAKYTNGYFCAQTGYFPSCEYSQQSEEYQAVLARVPGQASSTEILNKDVALVNTYKYLDANEHWTKFIDAPFVGSSVVREKTKAIFSKIFMENGNPEDVILDFYRNNTEYVRG